LSPSYTKLKKKFDPDLVQFCQYNPFLGIIPYEISDLYPASHYVMSRLDFQPKEFPIFSDTWETFFAKNNFDTIYLPKEDKFIKFFAKKLPKNIKKKFSIN